MLVSAHLLLLLYLWLKLLALEVPLLLCTVCIKSKKYICLTTHSVSNGTTSQNKHMHASNLHSCHPWLMHLCIHTKCINIIYWGFWIIIIITNSFFKHSLSMCHYKNRQNTNKNNTFYTHNDPKTGAEFPLYTATPIVFALM